MILRKRIKKRIVINLRFELFRSAKSFHGRSLPSTLVTGTSMQVSPPELPCAASKALQVNKIDARQVGLVPRKK